METLGKTGDWRFPTLEVGAEHISNDEDRLGVEPEIERDAGDPGALIALPLCFQPSEAQWATRLRDRSPA